MGLQDRDYMHERKSPFTPPKGRQTSTLMIILVIVSTMFLLYKCYGWLLDRGIPQRITQRVAAPGQPHAAPEVPVVQGVPLGWVPCIVNGQVLYSASGCPDKTATTHSADPPSRQPPQDSSPRVVTLFHCKAYNGGTFWVNTHCNQHKALVDRMVSVPGNLSFEQQVQIAEVQRNTASAAVPPRNVVINNATTASRDVECEAMDDQIAHLDAMARQPQSAQTQDWIREKRKAARDRQFSLRC
jgi:hypothetical protein